MIDKNLSKHVVAVVLLCLVSAPLAVASSFTSDQIISAIRQLRTYDYAGDPEVLNVVEEIVRYVADRAKLRALTEQEMIALLESDATDRARQFVCQQLWIIGTDASVGTLTTMLLEKNTAEMACYALRTHPSDAAGRALRGALNQVDDDTMMRIVHILGDRRDAASVDQLVALMGFDNADIAKAAVISLGEIGTDKGIDAIEKARAGASGQWRDVLTRAWLRGAESRADGNRVRDALVIYEGLFDASEPLWVRRAALVSALQTGHEDAAALMLAAIRQDNPMLKAAGIAHSLRFRGPAVTEQLVAALETKNSQTQMLLIEALGRRDDAIVKDAVTIATDNTNVDVRIAAYNVLARVGDASSAALLCQALGRSAIEREVETVLACLRRMSTDGVDRVIVDALGSANATLSRLLIGVISDRKYHPAKGTLYGYTRDENPMVAKAALRAIGSLGECRDVSNLIDLAIESANETVQDEAISATVAITRTRRCEESTGKLAMRSLKRTDSVAARCALMRVLPVAPSASALQWLQRASEDPDAQIRDRAIRTLARYPDAAAAEALLRIFERTQDKAHRVVALRGCIRLCRTTDTARSRATELYGRAMQQAQTATERKLILSGLGEVVHPAALQMALAALEREGVKAEAAITVIALARRIAALDPGAASAAAQRILDDAALRDLHAQAKEVIDAIRGRK